jgi:L-ascorbate metabolism protein UlaG (beta-lactamase superfamily)
MLPAMNATLQWFGTATWRLTVDGFVCWLDAYIERAVTALPPPERAADVQEAGLILIGHSHFDHIAEAGLVARNTGATVAGSALSCEIVQDEGLPGSQTVVCSGGEDLRFGPLRVRTFPSLHGFNGLREWPDPEGRDRKGRIEALRQRDPGLCEAALGHMANIPEKQQKDGGPLAYLIEWPGMRLFWHDTPGMVKASWEAASEANPDIALLSAAAAFSTPNVDGEPFEAGQVPFVEMMAGILKPGRVILNHHDDWCPPITYHLDEKLFRPGLKRAGIELQVVPFGATFSL